MFCINLHTNENATMHSLLFSAHSRVIVLMQFRASTLHLGYIAEYIVMHFIYLQTEHILEIPTIFWNTNFHLFRTLYQRRVVDYINFRVSKLTGAILNGKYPNVSSNSLRGVASWLSYFSILWSMHTLFRNNCTLRSNLGSSNFILMFAIMNNMLISAV